MAPDDKDNGFSVYCDQTNDGGGWLVFQKRSSPFTTLFSKNWTEYEDGFSHSMNSFWLGNQYLSRLTKPPVQLRIELVDRDGCKGYAVYNNFSISGPEDNYRLSVGAYVEGTSVMQFMVTATKRLCRTACSLQLLIETMIEITWETVLP